MMHTLGTAEIIKADSRNLPLDDNSVDLVVTSPPYFALRSYQDGGEHYAGQIGDEPTPAEFVASLLEVTRECVRVLKPSGSLWVNLGDKYSQRVAQRRSSHQDGLFPDREDLPKDWKRDKALGLTRMPYQNIVDPATGNYVREKSLIGIPWRYALACIDDLGLILRAEVIWSKPNGLPESVTDRVRRSHEQWFCFEQSGGVEAEAQSFPFCPLCGRPVDARSTLVARLKEVDGGVESPDLTSEVRPDQRVDRQHAPRRDGDEAASASSASVPVVEGSDADVAVDAANLLQNGRVPVVDADAEDGATLPIDQRDGSLSVDDSGKPADVCECVGHPLIINDEPWIPQSLAAEIMQSVADGECDPQQAADFLAGDYARNHSVWFHFTLSPRYFSAVDEIREQYAPETTARYAYGFKPASAVAAGQSANGPTRADGGGPSSTNPLGKLPGSVWTVPTEPLRVPDHLGVDHFAAFPTEWPKRIIHGWSPAGVCVKCGEGRRAVRGTICEPCGAFRPNNAKACPECGDRRDWKSGRVVDASFGATDWSTAGHGTPRHPGGHENKSVMGDEMCACPEPTWETSPRSGVCIGCDMPSDWAEGCSQGCEPPTLPETRPAVVLDPFGGTGTTALVAKALGRTGISVDMSADYCRLAEWRTNDRDQLAKVLGVAKAEPVDVAEQSLFDLLGEETA